MRTLKRTITIDVEIDYKVLWRGNLTDDGVNVYQIIGIRTPELEKICKEIVENEECFND
jgi:hypothetical protein